MVQELDITLIMFGYSVFLANIYNRSGVFFAQKKVSHECTIRAPRLIQRSFIETLGDDPYGNKLPGRLIHMIDIHMIFLHSTMKLLKSIAIIPFIFMVSTLFVLNSCIVLIMCDYIGHMIF